MKGSRSLIGLFRDEDGLETIEYAILTGIIVVGTLALIVSIALWVNNKFDTVDGSLQST